MKKLIVFNLSLLFFITLLFFVGGQAYSATKNNNSIVNGKKLKIIKPIKALQILNNNGEKRILGSVLNPKEDEINILMQSLLATLKKGDLSKFNLILTSTLDSTKSFTIPRDAISIQNKKINKKFKKYLTISLYNLKNASGSTVSPSSLPSGSYKLRFTGKNLDLNTDSFDYDTPVLIVGTVQSMSSGLVSIEDLSGQTLSERAVATDPNGAFFTEVRANNLTAKTLARKYNQLSDTNTDAKKLNTGIIHAVTDKDLLAIVPLDNDPKNNTAITNKPITVNESTTLSASLAKESAKEGNSDLAFEIAQDKLDALASQTEEDLTEEEEFEDFICDKGDIEQFADECDPEDEETLASIGKEFKEFVKDADCNFPEFKLLKSIIPNLSDDANLFIGKGYCEAIIQKEDQNRPCDTYFEILSDYEIGFTDTLPCPPSFCSEFRNIKPPKCYTTEGFCESPQASTNQTSTIGLTNICRGPKCFSYSGSTCINKPVKDLYCARIGIDIEDSECTDQYVPENFFQAWTITTSSQGNQYCVPIDTTNTAHSSTSFNSTPTPQETAENCELYTCHKDCEEEFSPNKFTSTQEDNSALNDCHFVCDAEAGRTADCSSTQSKYFSIKCCEQARFDYPTTTRSIKYDTQICLCESRDNFDDKGFAKEEAKNLCKNKCPKGYEKDQNTDNCFPICGEGFVRDQNGNCRKKCPAGSIQDDFGNCRENIRCGIDQYSDPTGTCRCNSDGSIATSLGPEGCKKSQNNYCGSNMLPNNVPGEAGCICPSGLPYWDGYTNACVATCPNGNPPASTSANLPPKSPIPCSGYTSQCSQSTPIKCSDGRCVVNSADCTVQRYCEAGQIPSRDSCSCASPGYDNGPNTHCQCPPGYSIAYSKQGCGTQTTQCGSNMLPNNVSGEAGCICPSGLPYWDSTACVATCPNGTPPSSASANLPPKSPIPCSSTTTCTSPKVLDTATNTCQCPSGQETDPNNTNNCRTICNSPKVRDSAGTCTCPSGTQVDPSNANNCVAITCPSGYTKNANGQCEAHKAILSSASISNSDLTVTYSKNFSECVLLIDANDNTYILHNGVNSYGLLCSSANQSGGTTTSTNSLGNFLVYPGKQVKLCKNNSSTLGYASLDLNSCSQPLAITDNNIITLSSAVLSGGNLTINYSKNFSDCVGLIDPNNNNYKVTSQNQYCSTSGTSTIPTSSLVGGYNSTLQVGSQVKLCLTATGMPQTCSAPITVTSQ